MGTRIKKNPSFLYEVFCEVGIPNEYKKDPWISWKYPQKFNDKEILKSVPGFAYPSEFGSAVQHFSFVLTNIDSQWTFGFCRSSSNSSSCYVILSFLPWHEVFYKILNHIAELTNKEEASKCRSLPLFLENLFHAQIPEPGLELHVLSKTEDFVTLCPDLQKLPSIPENRNMTEYFNAIDAQNMMMIFASMLHERRILISSSKLSRLSACVQAANALIYPMHWQHIYIPVLPKHLSDYLSAPMPFLIGIPASTLAKMKITDMGDIVYLDADKNAVESPFADLDALPSEVVQGLRNDLKKPQELLGDCVARAFLRALVRLMGGYWSALQLTDKISFCPEKFVLTRPLPVQPFLHKMLELQIFQQFIESRLKNLNAGRSVNDEFELELTAHEDKASFGLRTQYKDFVFSMKKEGGAFLKNVKHKVKDTSKKAYKDIRSKIHEIQNHTTLSEEPPDVPKRRGSAPTTLNAIDLYHRKNTFKKELSQSRLKESQIDNAYPNASKPDILAPVSPLRQSTSALDSPQLTFQPIDVDLMSDLHEVIFKSCSLCSSHSDTFSQFDKPPCGPECAASPFKQSTSIKSPATPLPLPPGVRNKVESRSSSSDLLIALDSEPPCNNDLKDIIITPKFRSTNPFHQCNSEFGDIVSANDFNNIGSVTHSSESNNIGSSVPDPIFRSVSGPRVKNLVEKLQSPFVPPRQPFLSASTEGLKTVSSMAYEKSQVMRTVSTPPSSTHPSSMLFLQSVSKVTTNPFIMADNKNNNCSKDNLNLSAASWENFQ